MVVFYFISLVIKGIRELLKIIIVSRKEWFVVKLWVVINEYLLRLVFLGFFVYKKNFCVIFCFLIKGGKFIMLFLKVV